MADSVKFDLRKAKKQLRDAIANSHLQPADLAKACHCTTAQIYNATNPNNPYDIKTTLLACLCHQLKVNPADIIQGYTPPLFEDELHRAIYHIAGNKSREWRQSLLTLLNDNDESS